MREDLRIYVEDVVENIDSLNGYNLTNYLMDEVLRADSYELDEDNTLDISSYTDKLEFLKAIYENIKRPEDQQLFIREVLENERYLDYRIIEEFRSMVEVPEELEEIEEELEEEQELETPENNYDYDDSSSEESEENNEEELEETHNIRIQYPNNDDYPDLPNNELWEGKTHEIVPDTLYEFVLNNEQYYFMNYLDNNTPCITFLKKDENGNVVNIPLDDYTEVEELLAFIDKKVGIKDSNINVLPEEIKLGNMEKREDLINKAKVSQRNTTEEGPAITAYKKETERLEQELEELRAKLNGSINVEDEATKEMDEIINNTSYPEIENISNEIESVKKEIEDISNSIDEKNQEKERYEKLQKDYEEFYKNKSLPIDDEYKEKMGIYSQRIRECEEFIKVNNEKKANKESILERLNKELSEVKGPLYNIEVWKLKELYDKEIEKLENTLKEVKALEDKYYNESRSVPLDILGMSRKLETQIANMKPLFTQLVGIRSDINLNNPEYKPLIDEIKNGRKINAEVNEDLSNNYNSEKNKDNPNINDEELRKYIEELDKIIAERKENQEKYYDALKDINEIANDIKTGKKPEDEEIKNKVDNVNNKINSITDDSLKEELNNYLNKALGMEKIKDPDKWKRWVSGIAGFALGAGVIGLTPLGLPGALMIAAGTQLAKHGVKGLHEKFVKEAEELGKENEITNIEKTGKLQEYKEKFKEKMRDENFVRNINWFLNGTAIGAITMGGIEQITNMMPSSSVTPEPTPTPEPTAATPDPYSNLQVGNNANGLNLSQGYDSANWAANNLNVESLNQQLVNGDSVIQRIAAVGENGKLINGNSVQELISKGFSEDQISVLIGKNGTPQAWTNLAELTNNVGRTL